MGINRHILPLGLALLCLAAPLLAERPVGPEVRLNAITAGDQFLADLDVAGGGKFVAVWLSHVAPASPWRIVARGFNSDLSPRTPEIFVAAVPNDISSLTARVGVDRATGNFVVVWSAEDPALATSGLFARRFSATGASLGPALVLGAPGSGRRFPEIAREGANFVVVWQQPDAASTPDIPSDDVVGRRFNAAGAPLGAIFPVGVGAGSQGYPSIAMNASGRFAVAFEQDGDIVLGTWSPAATPLLPLRVISGAGENEGPQVALAKSGRIFAEWSNDRIDDPVDDFGHNFGVAGVVLREDGAPVLGPGRLNMHMDNIQAATAAAVKSDGGFLAGWISYLQDGSGTGEYGRQIFPASAGPEFRATVATAGNQLDLEFGTFGDGRGVAAYSTPRVGYDIVARRMVP